MKQQALLAFILFIVAYPALSTPNKILKAPLKRVVSELEQPTTILSNTMQSLLAGSSNVTNNSIVLPMLNFKNVQYMTELDIGNQGTFRLQVDTGSGILWVPQPGLTDFSKHYNCSESPTCKDKKTRDKIQYAQGNVYGNIVTEQVKFGDQYLNNTPMLVIDSDANFNKVFFDGLIGVGPSDDSKFPKLYIDQMREQKLIDHSSFSLYLGPSDPNGDYTPDGVIIFGGYDTQYFQTNETDFKYVDVSSSQYWGLSLNKMYIGSDEFSLPGWGWTAVVDSGTSLSIFPDSIFTDLIQNIAGENACYQDYTGLYVCECEGVDSLEDVEFTFDNGVTVMMKSEDYAQYEMGNCYLLFQEVEGLGNTVVLGDIFIRNYYIYFDRDNNQIGFSGRLSHHDVFNWWYVIIIVLLVIIGVCICCHFVQKNKRNQISQNTNNYQNNFGNTGQEYLIGGSNNSNNRVFSAQGYYQNPNNPSSPNYNPNAQQFHGNYSPPNENQ